MTSYPGPWIQAPDYVADGGDGAGGIAPDVPTVGWSLVEEEQAYVPGSPPAPVSSGAAQASQAGANVSLGLEVDVPFDILMPLAPFGAMQYSTQYQAITPPGEFSPTYWRISRRALTYKTPRLLSPYTGGTHLWAPTILFPPPGAIGWEWSDGTPTDYAKASTPLALEVAVTPSDFGADNTTDPPSPIDSARFVSLVTSTGLYTSQGVDPSDVDSAYLDTITHWEGIGDTVASPIGPGPFTLDLTSDMDDRGRVVLSQRMNFEALMPKVPLDLTVNGGIGYGYTFAITPRWTLRPPIFRWLYATPQITSAPPLRHTQRDDRHGPSPRNRPARSRQAGLRNTGYL